jgi:hypothetical protein
VALWLGLGLAAWWLWNPWIDLALAAIGVAVTVHLVRLRTVTRSSDVQSEVPDGV